MNGREDLYTWTEPYIDNSQVFVVPTDSGIKSQADLAGKKVGVQKDSSALAALEGDSKDLADTFGNLTQYADYNTAFMDLTAGAIDAVAIDIGVANYEIGQRGSGYKILDDYLSTEQYAVGFKLGNTELHREGSMSLLTVIGQLMSGMGMTCAIFFLTLLFSLPLGLVVALLRMHRNKVISVITRVYISIMRGTPLMLQVIVVYFAPYYVFRVQISQSYRFAAVIIAFVLNYAAYFAEIYRSGIQSVIPRHF